MISAIEAICRSELKRVYEPAEKADGVRILVDRFWPRGISKEKGCVDEWLKELAPSDKLRKWFSHRPERWKEFNKRYRLELQTSKRKELIRRLSAMVRTQAVTLLFATKDEKHNNARVLYNILKHK